MGDAADLIKNFDFSKMIVNTSKKTDYLNFGLAPSFGALSSESIKMMDDKLKIIISGTTRAIEKIPFKDRSWEKVISTLQQNTLLEPMDEHGVQNTDKLIKNYGAGVFRCDGSPDSTIVKEVEVWFKNLIQDEDVINSTGIDINVLGKIVASTGAAVDSFETFFAKKVHHEQTMIEIGILRYPDIEHPFFKVYRIKLVAWSDCSRVLFVQDDKNGITGEYSMRRYKPRDNIIKDLKEETKKRQSKKLRISLLR